MQRITMEKQGRRTTPIDGTINQSKLYLDGDGYVVHLNETVNKKDWHMMLIQLVARGYTPSEAYVEIRKSGIAPKGSNTMYNFFSDFKIQTGLKFRIEIPIIICDNCGNDIKRTPSCIHNHNFCNQKCMGEWYSKRCGENHPLYGRITSEETRRKISAKHQGISYDEWEFFVRDSPYCPLFNEECRESNREKYHRRCFLTGLPEYENITSTGKWQHLSVHHVDMDKMQGCDGKRWKLVPICLKWHNKVHNELWERRIIWLLNNVWNNNEYI